MPTVTITNLNLHEDLNVLRKSEEFSEDRLMRAIKDMGYFLTQKKNFDYHARCVA